MKLTKNQFRKSMAGILERLEIGAAGQAGRRERRERAEKDFWVFFRHYLPHYGGDATPEFHKEIIRLLENGSAFTAIAAPRGFAKSTLVSFAYVVWKILTGERRFIVIVSATDKLASDLAEFIRMEFRDNPRILEDYGGQPIETGRRGDFTVRKTRVLALGRRRALRGFRSRQHRPDLIILDDIEKDGEAFSPDVVRSTLDIIVRGLIPALDPKKGHMILAGTVLRERSAAGIILRSGEEPFCHWQRRVYKALEEDGQGGERSLWEARFPAEKLHDMRAAMGSAAFLTEYQNMPRERDQALFLPEWFTEGEDEADSPMAVFIDPSPDGIKKNDYKAAVFAAKAGGRFVIVDGVFVQGPDTEFFRRLAEAYRRHRRRIVAAAGESNGFQGYFLKDLRDFFEKLGIILPLRPQRNTAPKETRIARLAGYFETGRLVFAKGAIDTLWAGILKEQLEYFPHPSAHDDAPDALAGAVAVLEDWGKSCGVTMLPSPGKPKPRGF